MTAETKTSGPLGGIDVCSGPSLTRAERIAQEAARFVPRRTPGPAANDAAQPTPRVEVAE